MIPYLKKAEEKLERESFEGCQTEQEFLTEPQYLLVHVDFVLKGH